MYYLNNQNYQFRDQFILELNEPTEIRRPNHPLTTEIQEFKRLRENNFLGNKRLNRKSYINIF